MKAKRYISMLLLLSIVVTCLSVSAFSAGAESADPNAPDVNDATRKEAVEELNEAIDLYIETKSATRSTSGKNLSVTLYQQNNTYYCGPACVQMAIKYLTGTLYSQSTLGSYMGTSSNGGTYVYQIANCLNAYVGSGSYRYVLTSETSFASGLVYSIDKNKPVVCQVKTGYLPNYGGSPNTGHYVLAKGYYVAYSGSSAVSNCYYNDPHYNSSYYGTFTCTMDEMITAINSHSQYYIMGT